MTEPQKCFTINNNNIYPPGITRHSPEEMMIDIHKQTNQLD